MIIQCAKCATKLKIDETKATGVEITVQCPKCQQKNRVSLHSNSSINEAVSKPVTASIETMHCRECNNLVSKNAVVCPSCGVPPKVGRKYCNECGGDTNEQAVICVRCGVSLKPAPLNISFGKQDAFRNPALWASLIIILSFFLPWLDAFVVKISGWNLRDLIRFKRLFDDEDYKAHALVNLMYLVPALAALIAISYFKSIDFIQKRLRSFKIIVGVYPYLFLVMLLTNETDNMMDFIAYGFYFTLAASTYLLYDAIVNKSKYDHSNMVDPPTSSSNTVITTSILNTNAEPFAQPTESKKNVIQNQITLKHLDVDETNGLQQADVGYDLILEQERNKKLKSRLILGAVFTGLVILISIIYFMAGNTSSEGLPIITSTQPIQENAPIVDNYAPAVQDNMTPEKKTLKYLYSSNAGLLGFYDDGTVAGCPRCDLNENNVDNLLSVQPHARYEVFNDYLMIDGTERIDFKTDGSFNSDWAVINYEWLYDIDIPDDLKVANNGGIEEGTKVYCDDGNAWNYIVTITEGNKIEMKVYASATNTAHTDKSKVFEFVTGRVINGSVLADDPKYNNTYYFENGILYSAHNEGGYNPNKECSK